MINQTANALPRRPSKWKTPRQGLSRIFLPIACTAHLDKFGGAASMYAAQTRAYACAGNGA